MAKPSIFSKDYEKRIKQRKRRNFFIIVIAVIILGLLIFIGNTFKDQIKNNLNEIKKEAKIEEQKKAQKEIKEQNKEHKNQNATVENKKPVVKEEKLSVELDNGVKFIIVNNLDDKNNKIIKSVDTNNNDLFYDINTSKHTLLVCNNKTQNMYFVDLNGNKQDINNKQYVSTSGTTYSKDAILQSNPSYIWGNNPKFIDDDNMAYVSQLPWFNKTTKYIWIYNIKNKTQFCVQNIEGNDIKFDKITDKGLTTIVDGKNMYLKVDGTLIE